MQRYGQSPFWLVRLTNLRKKTAGYLLFVAVAGLVGVASLLRAIELNVARSSSGDIQVPGDKTNAAPTLWFACDGATSDIEGLLGQPGLISDLQDLKAGVALALPELSQERAGSVLKLNRAGIPVAAWLPLPGEEGYYWNASNSQLATARFNEFKQWSATYGLHWASIGLDIEPNIQDFEALRSHKWHLFFSVIGRYFNPGRIQRAKATYADVIREMHRSGYKVDTYQFPFIADERDVHSTLLERITGIVDVRADREVLMLYTSFNPALDSAWIWAYGPEAQAIAVGITTGSDADPRFHPLNWMEFSRDLLVARHFSSTLGVYSLEGCAKKGFLDRLKTMNWDQPVVISGDAVLKAERFRSRVQRAIWIGSHLRYFAGLLLILVVLFVGYVLNRRKMRE